MLMCFIQPVLGSSPSTIFCESLTHQEKNCHCSLRDKVTTSDRVYISMSKRKRLPCTLNKACAGVAVHEELPCQREQDNSENPCAEALMIGELIIGHVKFRTSLDLSTTKKGSKLSYISQNGVDHQLRQ